MINYFDSFNILKDIVDDFKNDVVVKNVMKDIEELVERATPKKMNVVFGIHSDIRQCDCGAYVYPYQNYCSNCGHMLEAVKGYEKINKEGEV